jgi:transposase
VEEEYSRLLTDIRQSPAVFADETSWWVGKPGWWLWAFTTPSTTVYRVEKSRGSQVVRDTLGDEFGGMLVSDCLASYDPPPYRKHKCLAHHLRAIRQAQDRPDGQNSAYLRQWRALFTLVRLEHAYRSKTAPEEFLQHREHLEQACDDLLARPPTAKAELAVFNRLQKQRAHLLGCLYEPAAEPTNNRAERALRPAVIARKLSCGNKTSRGRRAWEILTSLATTWHQRGLDIIDMLAPKLALDVLAG